MNILNFNFCIDWPGKSSTDINRNHPWQYNKALMVPEIVKKWKELSFLSKIFDENKVFEIQFEPNWDVFLEFGIRWTHKCDHAGLNVTIGFAKLWLDLNFYDCRHWSYKNDRYQTQEDRDEEHSKQLTADDVAEIITIAADDIESNPSKYKKIIKKVEHDEIKHGVLTELLRRNSSNIEVQNAIAGLSKFLSDYKITNAWWLKRKENGEKFVSK